MFTSFREFYGKEEHPPDEYNAYEEATVENHSLEVGNEWFPETERRDT